MGSRPMTANPREVIARALDEWERWVTTYGRPVETVRSRRHLMDFYAFRNLPFVMREPEEDVIQALTDAGFVIVPRGSQQTKCWRQETILTSGISVQR